MKGHIYKITNLITNKSYIGFTKNPKRRWIAHQKNKGSKLVFHAIQKYGLENLVFEVIADDILENEDLYIQKHNTIYPNGYNLTPGGNLPPNHKGKTYEDIYGKDRAIYQKQMRARLQKDRGGYGPKTHTDETKKKISRSTSGNNNPMFGKKHTDETKKKISSHLTNLQIGEKNPNASSWKLTSPTGEEYLIKGTLKQFCLENNLSYSTVRTSYYLKRTMRSKWKIEKI